MEWTVLTLAAIVGAVVGLLAGIFGVGGGFLIVPLLNLALGIPIELAVGASACQVLGPATTALLARRIRRHQMQLPLTVAGGLLIGTYLGGELLHRTRQYGDVELPSGLTPLAEVLVLFAYLILLVSVALFLFWEVHRSRQGTPVATGWLNRIPLPPHTAVPGIAEPMSIPILGWFGLAIGLISGMLGISGGLILLPALVYLFALSTQEAVISTLVIVWIVGVQATVVHAWNGYVRLELVLALLLGGTVGARLGSELGPKLRGRHLRLGFAWVVVAAAGVIAAKLVRLFLA